MSEHVSTLELNNTISLWTQNVSRLARISMQDIKNVKYAGGWRATPTACDTASLEHKKQTKHPAPTETN
jgi:hypothetical protein